MLLAKYLAIQRALLALDSLLMSVFCATRAISAQERPHAQSALLAKVSEQMPPLYPSAKTTVPQSALSPAIVLARLASTTPAPDV